MNEHTVEHTPQAESTLFEDSVLDLGDLQDSAPQAVAQDVILDLDFDEPTPSAATVPARPPESVHEPKPVAVSEFVLEPMVEAEKPSTKEIQEWLMVPEAQFEALSPAPKQADAAPRSESASVAGLSPEAIDAIARRVIEQLSDKVVREIAWEVVPDLAELMIKRKLDES